MGFPVRNSDISLENVLQLWSKRLYFSGLCSVVCVCYHAEISALLHVDSDCKSIIQSSQIKQTFLQFNERHGVVGMRLY